LSGKFQELKIYQLFYITHKTKSITISKPQVQGLPVLTAS